MDPSSPLRSVCLRRSRLPRSTTCPCPPAERAANVTVVQVDRAGFFARSHQATVVQVPLAAGLDRASGQFAYLNAMAMEKLVVVTDSPGVRDYSEDSVTGLIGQPADPAALHRALDRARDPANRARVREIGREAACFVRTHYSQDTYAQHMLDAIDRVIALHAEKEGAARAGG